MKMISRFVVLLSVIALCFASCEEKESVVDKPVAGPSEEGKDTLVYVTGVLRDEDGGLGDTADFLAPATSFTAAVQLYLSDVLESEATAEVYVDADYVEEYNRLNAASCASLPEGCVVLGDGGKMVVAAGEPASAMTEVAVGLSALETGVTYLLPLSVRAISDNLVISDDSMRICYFLKRFPEKEVRNVLYFEVNDTNPLNALEYRLEDGRMFFDAVVLFAANINYNADADSVYLNCNPNVQALLDESDVYLQPLRERGIKVYLGLLGNHDAAGLGQLSDWGARQWAAEVAGAVNRYRLDGVALDDEYSQRPVSGNRWFTTRSYKAGARLAYELEKAMAQACSWPVEVSAYTLGVYEHIPAVEDDGVTYEAGDFVDFIVGNYGMSAVPQKGMTLKDCSGMSIECRLGSGFVDEDIAGQIRDSGYGWLMWFGFKPDSDVTESFPFIMMSAAARGLYGMSLLPPAGYYKKVGEGVYDECRYEILKK